MKKKIIYFIFPLLIILLSFSLLLNREYKVMIADYLKSYLPQPIYNSLLFVADFDRSQKRLNSNYNVVFLPETQQLELNFKKVKLPFLKKSDQGYYKVFRTYRYFFDADDDKIIYSTKKGEIYYSDLDNLTKYNKIKTNLNSNIIIKDIKLNGELIYLSIILKNKECLKQTIFEGKFDKKEIIFKKKFEINDCKKSIESGKIVITDIDSKKYLLLATASNILVGDKEKSPGPQDDNSLWGKILKIDLSNFDYEIYSKGHRNILGLTFDKENNKIISTENGPRGGDEINVIQKNKNYGWELASYGKKYRKGLKSFQYKDHEELGFEEPIHAFIPSLGISQITKVDSNFDDFYWNNNFLIGTLQNKALLRVKFDKNFNKVLFVESIYIGERIIDIKYIKKSKIVILALENSGSLGILKK